MGKGTVLVTGGAGFIGTHTAIRLLERGYRVRALDALLPPVHVRPERPPGLPGDVELIVGDVRNKSDMARALEGVEAVVHLAAYQDYLPDFSTFFHVNTVGTAMLYEVAVERRLPLRKIVVASSQATYGEGAYRCAEHGRVMPPPRADAELRGGAWEPRCPVDGGELELLDTDETEVNPHNQYALSKYTQEMVALNLGARYGIPTTCLRYSIVQGPMQSFHNAYSGVCRVFTLRVLNGKRPVAFEDGRQVRDYVWVGDVAEANSLVLDDPRSDQQVYNVAGPGRHTVLEYGAAVARALNREDLLPDVPGFYRYGDTRHVVSSSERLKALGWRQTLGVSDIVSRYAEWVRVQPDQADHLDATLARMLELGTVRRAEASLSRSTG